MLQIEAVTTYEGFLALKPVWDALHEKSGIEFPFLTFEWMSCWWKSYGKGSELLVLAAKADDAIIGIAPLMITKIHFRGFNLKAVTFIANYHSNRAGFILTDNKRETVAAIMEYLKSRYCKADVILFDFLGKDSENEIVLSEYLEQNRFHLVRMRSLVSPYIKIEQDWDEYYKKRTAKFRLKLNNTNNVYNRRANYEIIRYSNNEIDKAMGELLSISKKTWQYENGTAIASSQENIDFYSSLAYTISAKGWLDLWVLRINNIPVAFFYYMVFKNKVFALKTGFDKEYSKDTPGEFLSTNALKYYFNHGMTEYDLLGDNMPYKQQWTTTCREHVKYIIFNRTIKGNILYFGEKSIIRALKAVKEKWRLFKGSHK